MNARTILVKIDSVMDLTGESADTIINQVQDDLYAGRYKWVWNLSETNGDVLDRRFWVREILDASTGYALGTNRLKLDQVIAMILPPNRKNYLSGEVCFLLRIRRPKLKALREELNGKLSANSSFFPREGLEQFLRTRWLGAEFTAETPRRREGAMA